MLDKSTNNTYRAALNWCNTLNKPGKRTYAHDIVMLCIEGQVTMVNNDYTKLKKRYKGLSPLDALEIEKNIADLLHMRIPITFAVLMGYEDPQ